MKTFKKPPPAKVPPSPKAPPGDEDAPIASMLKRVAGVPKPPGKSGAC